MARADFRSLFSQAPKTAWRSGLGPRGGSRQVQPDTPTDDAAGDDRFEAFRKAWRHGDSPSELFGGSAFRLGGAVGGDGAPNRRADVAKIETFLAGTGHYKPLKDGPSGYINDGLVDAIRTFQKQKSLVVDGRINPSGPTISSLEKTIGGRLESAGTDILNKGSTSKAQSGLTEILVARYDPSRPRKVEEPLPVARPGDGRTVPVSQRASGRSLLNFSGNRDAAEQGGGSSGMVHVRAYEQNRDGREVQVSEYDRRPPDGSAGAGSPSPGGGNDAASMPWESYLPGTEPKTENRDEKTPPNLHPTVTLEFDGHEVRAIEDGKIIRRWPAVSGRPGFQGPEHQGEENKGPIPEGDWVLRQSERQDIKDISPWERTKSAFGRGKWRGLEPAWGNSRVWLEPGEETDTKGRHGFSVHGGTEPGSAGCIDMTSHMDGFIKYFSGLGKDVKLHVQYGK